MLSLGCWSLVGKNLHWAFVGLGIVGKETVMIGASSVYPSIVNVYLNSQLENPRIVNIGDGNVRGWE